MRTIVREASCLFTRHVRVVIQFKISIWTPKVSGTQFDEAQAPPFENLKKRQIIYAQNWSWSVLLVDDKQDVYPWLARSQNNIQKLATVTKGFDRSLKNTRVTTRCPTGLSDDNSISLPCWSLDNICEWSGWLVVSQPNKKVGINFAIGVSTPSCWNTLKVASIE